MGSGAIDEQLRFAVAALRAAGARRVQVALTPANGKERLLIGGYGVDRLASLTG